ncbi:MAG: Ig-like domain-containing protein, partial [Anaerolineae bacterium]|nr:Ig-like domain-containing protein [Anaerolineae bacterium]
MKKNNAQFVVDEESELIDQALRHQAEKINPRRTFIERLSQQLRRERSTAMEKKRWRFPVWGFAAAAAMIVIGVFVVRGLWFRDVIPAQPTDIVVLSMTPETGPTQRPTTVSPPTPTEAPTPEPEPSFAADLPPAVVSAVPRPGEEVNTQAGILFSFTQPMDRQSVENSVKIQPQVEGTFAWKDDRNVTFTPKVLASATRYHVSLGVEAYAANGKALTSELTFAFSTIGPLTVTHTAPTASTADVRSDTPLIITTNYPMVPVTCSGQVADQDGQCAALPVEMIPEVEGQGMWVNTSIYRFDPLPGWDAGTTYTVRVPAGVRSVTGAELQEPFDWSFETALPRVVKITPANRDENVPLDAAVTVRFNTPMALQASEKAFLLSDAAGNNILGTTSWSENNTFMVFTPTQLLALDTLYTARVETTAQSVSGARVVQSQVVEFRT